MTTTRVALGRYRAEWDSTHLRVRIAGSPWGDALLLGSIGAAIVVLSGVPSVMGWKEGRWLPLYLSPVVLLLGGIGYRNGARASDVEIEASLTGTRSVRARRDGVTRTLPAGDVQGFELDAFDSLVIPEVGEVQTSGCGILMKTGRESIPLVPHSVAPPKAHAEALCRILNAVVLGRGSLDEAMSRSAGVRRQESIAVLVLAFVIVGLIGGVVYFFAFR